MYQLSDQWSGSLNHKLTCVKLNLEALANLTFDVDWGLIIISLSCSSFPFLILFVDQVLGVSAIEGGALVVGGADDKYCSRSQGLVLLSLLHLLGLPSLVTWISSGNFWQEGGARSFSIVYWGHQVPYLTL